MLASSGRTRVSAGGWRFEPKLDGWRALAQIHDGKVIVRSRAGRDLTRCLPELRVPPEVLGSCSAVLDGELIVGSGTADDFYRLCQRMASNPARSQQTATFAAFDLLWLDEDLCGLPYLDRRTALCDVGLRSSHWQTVASFDSDPEVLLHVCEEQGLEGIVAKRVTSRYRPGQRSKDWIKLKTPTWKSVHAERRVPDTRWHTEPAVDQMLDTLN